MKTNPYSGQKIVFFDGVCILCNSALNFLIKHDRKRMLKYASLQSEYGSAFFQQIQHYPVPEDTIIFYDEGRVFKKSTAVLKIAGYIGMPYSAMAMLQIIPASWRDGIYDLIARNRAKWFGTRDKCRIPDHETFGRIIA